MPEIVNSEAAYECAKCGQGNTVDAQTCAACHWPLTVRAWETAEHRISKITLDSSCINAKKQHPDLNQLETWAHEDRIHLMGAAELRKESRGSLQQAKAEATEPLPTNFFMLDSSMLDVDILAGPDMSDKIRAILFPTVANLNANQQSDVSHLAQHVRSGGDVFLTLDSNFWKNGKQEAFRRFGIWVFQPHELVELLKQLRKWE